MSFVVYAWSWILRTDFLSNRFSPTLHEGKIEKIVEFVEGGTFSLFSEIEFKNYRIGSHEG